MTDADPATADIPTAPADDVVSVDNPDAVVPDATEPAPEPPVETTPQEPNAEINPDPATPAPVTDPDADLRERIDTATSTLAPGQTVVTDALGQVLVTGQPPPEAVEPVAALAVDNDSGDTVVAIETPLGRIAVSFEADGEGKAWVFVKASSGNGQVTVVNEEIEVFRFVRG